MKAIVRILAISLMFCLAQSALADVVNIGVCIYDGTDTFMASLRQDLETCAAGRADLTIYDSRNDQNLQNNQVEKLLEAGVDALILNPADRLASGYLIEKVRQANIPVVFINREPLYEDLMLYDKAYYVGADAAQSGELSGKILADFFLTHPEADRNGDGVVQYVLLKGEPGHQDAELRTQYALKPLQDAGFPVEKLQEDTGMWQRQLAQDKMAGFLTAHGDRIECVISNNDDMALGAIDALKAAGYFTDDRFMPVVGVDGTAPALEAMQQGSLLGTVFNDGFNQAKASLELALLLAAGKEIGKDNFAYPITSECFVWIPYRSITQDTVNPQIP